MCVNDMLSDIEIREYIRGSVPFLSVFDMVRSGVLLGVAACSEGLHEATHGVSLALNEPGDMTLDNKFRDDLPEEIKTQIAALPDNVLDFASRMAQVEDTPDNLAEAYEGTHLDDMNFSKVHQTQRGYQVLNQPGVKPLVEYMRRALRFGSVLDGPAIRRKLTRWTMDSLDLLNGLRREFLEVRHPETNALIAKRPIVSVDDTSDLPDCLLPYISELVWHAELSSFEIRIDEKTTQKERLKAMELLGKSQGVFVERQEISGPGGAPVRLSEIDDDMSAVKAAEVYRDLLGLPGPGG